MTDTLPVHLNRDGAQAVAAEPSFEATGSFAVVLHNHGTPAHVHLRFDGDLARVVSVGTTNHYVESDDSHRVEVAVESDHRPIEGTLEVLTGFGARSASVAIDVVEPTVPEESVHVDESLGRPRTADPEPDAGTGSAVPPWLAEYGPVIGMALLALLVAVAAVAVSGELSLVVGIIVVLAGVGAAVTFLRQPA